MAERSAPPEFVALADRFRRATRVVWCAALALLGSFLFVVLARPSVRPWAVGAAVLVLGIYVYCVRRIPKMLCTHCGQDQQRNELGPYCPECGALGLPREGWFWAVECPACHRFMARGRSGREWKIHACSKCGQWLDEVGF